MEYVFDAPAGVSRLASGGGWIGGGFAVGRKFLISVSALLNKSTFLNWKPSSASFGGQWTVVSEIVVCFVWSTAELFLDHCANVAPAADVFSPCVWTPFRCLVNYPLVLRESWSLLCVDFFYLQFSFGASVRDSTLHFRALWRLHKSWLLAVPPVCRTPVDFRLRKLPDTPTCFEFLAYAHQKQDACRFTPKSSTCSSSVRGWHNCSKLFNSVLKSRALSLFTLAQARNMPHNFKLTFVVLGFRGGGATDYFLRCRDVLALR